MEASGVPSLLEWKRRTFQLYGEARAEADPAVAWERWRAGRDELFRTHPQSPLPAGRRTLFGALDYFDYDPAFRVAAELEPTAAESYEIATSGEEPMRFERIGVFRFKLTGKACELEAYWLTAYAGGLFVPFADTTSGKTTYGAGRYLLDTIKGSDLGGDERALVLDFNFAYNPSCAYDPRWVCPLATPANRLSLAVEAGEKL